MSPWLETVLAVILVCLAGTCCVHGATTATTDSTVDTTAATTGTTASTVAATTASTVANTASTVGTTAPTVATATAATTVDATATAASTVATTAPTVATTSATAASTAPTVATTAPTVSTTATATATAATAAATTVTAAATTATAAATTATAAATAATDAAATVTAAATTASAAATTATAAATTVTAAATTATAAATTASAAATTATAAATTATAAVTTATAAATTATAAATTATAAATTATAAATTATAAATTATAAATTATAAATTATAAATTATAAATTATAAATTATAAATTASTLGSTATVSVGPTTANITNSSYLISLALLWNGEDVSAEFSRQFNMLINPALKAACPASGRVNNTVISIEAVQITNLLSLDQVSLLQSGLEAQNYLFTGLRSNELTPLFESVLPFITVPGHPTMKFHVIAPMPLSLLQAALIRVIDQRIREGLYPDDLRNYRAAMFIDSTVDITQMTELFRYFRFGLLFFRFSEATLVESLVAVKSNGIINIIALLTAAQGDKLKLAAFQLNMFAYQYRWFLHGPRLINADFDSRMVTYSTNVTSLEFGRVQDTLRKDLRTTSAVLVYDLWSIWQLYLKRYMCNEVNPVNTTYKGYTGTFKLEPDGTMTRLVWFMEIYRGLEAAKQHIGEWSSGGSFTMLSIPDPARTAETSLNELKLNPFRMATVIIEPYVMYKTGVAQDLPLKDRLTGMYIELCKQIMADLKFTNYEFYLQPDGAFGVYVNNSWNGLIRTMLDGKAHLACAPLTIETSRKEAAAFTKVVHSSPQSILYKSAPADPFAEMFQFLQPLDTTIWLTVLGALAFVAIVLTVLHTIIPNKGVKLSFYNSMFFSFAEVVQGTSGAVPNQLSGRIVVAFFWFFTLFLLLTYIANYAAIRLLDGVTEQVDSLETLLQNSAYQFGVVQNTVTVTLLQSSTFIYMQQIYGLMADLFTNGFVANTTVGVGIMQNTSLRYALIGDHLQNKYLAEINCNLVNTGQFYELKSALALPLDNEYGGYVDEQIVRLAARIAELQQQFFTVPTSLKSDCTDRSFLGYVKMYTPPNPWEVKPGALTLTNTLGIAMINLFGCIFALLLSAVERSFSRVLQRRSNARRRTQVAEAYAMAQRPTMLE